jgi:hypothetical protein
MLYAGLPLTIAATAAVGAISLVAAARWKRAVLTLGRGLAAELGLDFEQRLVGPFRDAADYPAVLQRALELISPWRISGRRAGLTVWANPETRSSGKSSKTYLVVEAVYPEAVPFGFKAGREGALSRLGAAFLGLSDIQVGDRLFDDAVRLRSGNAGVAAALFSDQELRDAAIALIGAFPDAVADQASVRWERVGVRAALMRLPAFLDAAAVFFAALDGARARLDGNR